MEELNLEMSNFFTGIPQCLLLFKELRNLTKNSEHPEEFRLSEKLEENLEILASGMNDQLKNSESESKLLGLEAKIQFRVAFSVRKRR